MKPTSLSFRAVLPLLVLLALVARGTAAGAHETEITKIVSSVAGDDAHVPGLAVMVRKNGRTVFERGYGVRDLRSKIPNDARTNFRLASCTKQFTAMAIMLLVHDGKLRYDGRLTDIFPDFPEYGKQITIRNLLNHTSGLPDYEDLMDQAQAGHGGAPLWSDTRQIQDAEVLKLLEAQTQGKFTPGSKWSYSNSGYVMLGLIVAKISGHPFDEFLRARIFKPLKMEHTLAFINGKNEVPNRAYGHSKTGNGFEQTDQSSTSATLGDGGVYSNLEDLARWDDALAHHTLLSAEEMQPALAAFTLPDGSLPRWAGDPGDTDPLAGKPLAYGFGWFLDPYHGHQRMWHFGDTMGFKSAIERFPNDELTVIVLTNRADLDAPALATQIADLFLNK